MGEEAGTGGEVSSAPDPIKFEEFRHKLRAVVISTYSIGNIRPAKEIFHYCNALALHGIVTTKTLWASDIFSLNDASEVDYAMWLVEDVLKSFGALEKIYEKIRDGTLMTAVKKMHTHVCCFAAHKDSLSQWRAYGDGGYGFAIGFDPVKLQAVADVIVPVLYSENHQRERLTQFARGASELLLASASEPRIDELYETSFALVAMMAPLKNPVFSDEREWRAVRIHNDVSCLNFRPGQRSIVCYSKLAIPKECFTRIMQGPTFQHKEFGERSLNMFLHQNELDLPVESSVIPLRSL